MGLVIEGLGVLKVENPRFGSDCAVALLEIYVGTVEVVVDAISMYIDDNWLS